jgi:hypothetical protein
MGRASVPLKAEVDFASGGAGHGRLGESGLLALEHLLLHLELEAALGARIHADASVSNPFLRPEE